MIDARVDADGGELLHFNIEDQGDAALEKSRHIGNSRIIIALVATVGNDEVQDNGSCNHHENKYYEKSHEKSPV